MKFPVVSGQQAKILTFMFLAERLNDQAAMPFVQGTPDSQTAHELAMDFAVPFLTPIAPATFRLTPAGRELARAHLRLALDGGPISIFEAEFMVVR